MERKDGSGPVMVGIDIGTTTIAMELVDMVSGAEIDSYLCINRQRRYGADVISRIQASVEGKRKNCRKASGRTFYRPGKAYQGRRNCTGKSGNCRKYHNDSSADGISL